MKNFTKIIVALFLTLIASHSFAATPAGNAYDVDMNKMRELSKTELFLDDNFSDQPSVDLPGIHCVQQEKSRTEVEGAVGGVTTHRVTYKGFTCTYTN